MPFDEQPKDGGGRDPHDPERLKEITNMALLQTHINCENGGLCMFHGHLAVASGFLHSITENLRIGAIDPNVTGEEAEVIEHNRVEFAQLLKDTTLALKAQMEGKTDG